MTLDAFLDHVYQYHGQERLARVDIHRAAVTADLPADQLAILDGLPEGEYSQDEAAEALRQVPELLSPGDTGTTPSRSGASDQA
ncbi:hypothetical protein HC028_22395 [Planosporangium flavigriseum]|uniref:DUF2795 domain-containing protein n=1 Tax=Planosporangium flavigriseum TaxID=373681 RepID=A0A8J3LPM5_9ACTN|nr:hypothetical protein [Planosporangium flavigriseum]NJC67229.1 hypothetical protein [Planosporangium flavigriseum]GIG75194.1 hypothetical protein Pfl04_35980 [Planosporangium flavigriseum]